jgi:hypothetical protein
MSGQSSPLISGKSRGLVNKVSMVKCLYVLTLIPGTLVFHSIYHYNNSAAMVSHTLIAFIFALLGFSLASARSGGSYPRCIRTGRRTGMAHYRGWKIVGEDVSPSTST